MRRDAQRRRADPDLKARPPRADVNEEAPRASILFRSESIVRDGWRDRCAADDGITLIEVLMAVFILSVALFSLASVAIPSLSTMRDARERELGTNAASGAIEDVRALDFRGITMATGFDIGTVPADVLDLVDYGSGCVASEPFVIDGAAADPVELVSERAGTEVYTFVTWADTACSATGRDLKRITTVARWIEAGEVRHVDQSTLVASAGRGLPVPDFRLTPSVRELAWTPQQLTDGREQCAEHTLRNLGAEDRYRIAVVDEKGDPDTLVGPVGTAGLDLGDWNVRSFLEFPGNEAARNGAPPPEQAPLGEDVNGPTYDTRLRHDVTAEPRQPGSDRQVPPAASATMTFCYEPHDGDAAATAVRLAVVSRFDERRVEYIDHTLDVRQPEQRLYLQDRDHSDNHDRGELGNGNKTVYLPYVMGPLNPDTDDQIQNLGPKLYNWSAELDPVVGTQLLRETVDPQPVALRTLDWRYQFGQPTELLPGATLVVWVAPDGDGDVDGDGDIDMELLVQLDGLNAQEQTAENKLVWAGVAQTYTYAQTSPGWVRHEIQVPMTAGHLFETDQRLRLRVTCTSNAESDCHLAYDVATTYEAYLTVGLQ